MFGWSWTEPSVLGSQVFGQASMKAVHGGPYIKKKKILYNFLGG